MLGTDSGWDPHGRPAEGQGPLVWLFACHPESYLSSGGLVCWTLSLALQPRSMARSSGKACELSLFFPRKEDGFAVPGLTHTWWFWAYYYAEVTVLVTMGWVFSAWLLGRRWIPSSLTFIFQCCTRAISKERQMWAWASCSVSGLGKLRWPSL